VGEPATASEQAPARCDIAVVGGGILGLAIARQLALGHPRRSVCVLEREQALASHQSAHNSGVIHSGLYYAPGSLKARLCTRGARLLYEYCEARAIPHARSGKLVLAGEAAELPRLRELQRRGLANGVPGLRWLQAHEVAGIEPQARGLAALHSPETGVVDFRAVAHAYAADLIAAGGSAITGCEVHGVVQTARALRLRHSHGATEALQAVFCAGAWSDRLAVAAGAGPDPRIVPFRGEYLRLRPERSGLVRALIYPVPDPALPFLGVHLTRHAGGEVTLGPTALIAPARDAYRLRDLRREDLLQTLAWPGTWRLMRRYWRAGAHELVRAASRSALVRAGQRLVPALREDDLAGTHDAGLRAQALARDGRLIDDFVFSHGPRALHVRNAPSPGATASLAIAEHVCAEAERVFALDP
jgi:(S)-2-hydroxyglutarate dehydrogenase